MFAKDPPKNQTQMIDALLYLGMVHLIETTVTRKKVVLEADEARTFSKLQERLRKTANKFFENPTKTTLWLSSL